MSGWPAGPARTRAPASSPRRHWPGPGREADVPPGWLMPGSGIDAGKDLVACARRELKEETGLDSARLALAVITWSTPVERRPHSAVNVTFNAGTFPNTVVRLAANELAEHRWDTPEEAADVLLPPARQQMRGPLRSRGTGSTPHFITGDDC
ncbi:NUDIX domain-containing protein [Streptomyces sp. NPDC056549]|uniref:NUDIX domain-containing protein n=1 Tax=Streptomyces sp. NPDC056549 TaxID=3345864 RepID=UPI00368076B3